MALTTVSRVQNALRKTGAVQGDTTLITRLIKEVSTEAEKITRRFLQYGKYTEIFDGGKDKIWLKGAGIKKLNKIFINNMEIDIIEEIEALNLILDTETGMVWRRTGFDVGYKNVVVEYECGYEAKDSNETNPVPQDLEGAIIMEVVVRYRYLSEVEMPVTTDSGGIMDTSKEWLDKRAREILKRYKRVLV